MLLPLARHASVRPECHRGPLNGLRVLDLSRLVAGNMLTLQLADFGAEVIKIEPPGAGDPLRAWGDSSVQTHWKVYSRNKKSMTLNLREPEARDILLRLVDGTAVMVEGFRPGRLEEMGVGPEVLHARNPDLVLVRISGFGQTGPYRERPGFSARSSRRCRASQTATASPTASRCCHP